MKTQWKTIGLWLASLVSGVSVSSCMLYAPDWAPYQSVDITVQDEEGHPIPGIELTDSSTESPFSVFTRKNGNVNNVYRGKDYHSLKLRDIDGPENGGEFEEFDLSPYTSQVVTDEDKKKSPLSGITVTMTRKD